MKGKLKKLLINFPKLLGIETLIKEHRKLSKEMKYCGNNELSQTAGASRMTNVEHYRPLNKS
jgi:hypothetical protein